MLKEIPMSPAAAPVLNAQIFLENRDLHCVEKEAAEDVKW